VRCEVGVSWKVSRLQLEGLSEQNLLQAHVASATLEPLRQNCVLPISIQYRISIRCLQIASAFETEFLGGFYERRMHCTHDRGSCSSRVPRTPNRRRGSSAAMG